MFVQGEVGWLGDDVEVPPEATATSFLNHFIPSIVLAFRRSAKKFIHSRIRSDIVHFETARTKSRFTP